MAVTAVAVASSAAATAAFEYATMAVVGSAFAVEVAAIAIGAVAAIGTVYAINSIAQATGIIPKAPDASNAGAGAEAARGILLNSQSPVAPIPVIYGTRRVGGNFVFLGASGSNNEYLHLCLVLAEGEINGIGKIYFNDAEAINLTGVAARTQTSASSGTWSGLLDVTWHAGGSSQLADANMVTNISGWTNDHRLRGTAYLYLRLKFDQTAYASGLPAITVEVDGRTLYDPRTSTTAFSHNPALTVRDYLTNATYGRGIASANIDDASFITAANYCDQTVTLGGATVARYTCDGVIETTRSSMDIVRDLLTACRGLLVFTGGQYRLVLDKPETPYAAFSADNIIGAWTISMGDKTNTFNRLRAGFFNPANNWQADIAVAESTTLRTQDNGLLLERQIDLPFTAHAERAKMIAVMNLNQSRQQIAVEFTATLAGLRSEVGDVVYIHHSTPGWESLNGGSGKAFRILKIALQNNDEVRVICVEYDATVYDYGTIATVDATLNTTLPNPLVVAAPSAPVVTESLYVTRDGSGVKAQAALTWTAAADAFVRQYEIQSKPNGGDWTPRGQTSGTAFTVEDIAPGLHDFRVRAVNSIGALSAWASTTASISGLSTPPAVLTGIALQAVSSLAVLTWTQSTDLDVRVGGKIEVRHASLTSGATWANSVSMGSALSGTTTVAVLPLLAGTYLIRAIDSTGNMGTVATITTAAATVQAFSTLGTVTESPTFPGTHSDTFVDGSYLSLTGLDDIDTWASVDAAANFDIGPGGVDTGGTYTFAAGLDAGAVTRQRLRRAVTLETYAPFDYWDARASMLDTWADVDGSAGVTGDCIVEVRSTNDNPSGSPTWSAWSALTVAEFNARAFQFRAQLSIADAAHNIRVSALSVTSETI